MAPVNPKSINLPSTRVQSFNLAIMQMMNTERASFWYEHKFPFKPHKMLEILEGQGDDHIAGWNPNGLSFRIKKPEKLVRKIVPHYFKQTKYKSFQRQLNLYGFQLIRAGEYKGSYFHKDFVKSKPSSTHRIQRKQQASERTTG